jgi:hypothetical protein
LNASRKTSLMWLLNGNMFCFSSFFNRSLFTSVQCFIVESDRFACGCMRLSFLVPTVKWTSCLVCACVLFKFICFVCLFKSLFYII